MTLALPAHGRGCILQRTGGGELALSEELQRAIESHLHDTEALQTQIFALCWPNASPLADDVRILIEGQESLRAAATRLNLPWNPDWLVDAGFSPQPSASDGVPGILSRISWQPKIELCRLDDQAINANRNSASYRRRIAGEVAFLSLWHDSARRQGIDPASRARVLSSNTRGSRFKDILVHYLRNRLPVEWRVEPEVKLSTIRGLHMRQNLSDRKSDIVVIDEGRRLVAVISSKWTWRSDRGTEAAQMVPLARYRPDVPYALVTAEFPRADKVARESIEDRAYHVCPDWVGAWLAIYQLGETESCLDRFPTINDLKVEGRAMAEMLGLAGLDRLVEDLKASGEIL